MRIRKIFFVYRFVIIILLFYSLLVSCSSPVKQLTYLYDAKVNETYPRVPLPAPYRIRPNDQLYISVLGDDKLNTDFLNISTTLVGGNNSLELITYLVDENGNISYPQIGEIHVEGLTLLEVKGLMQKEVDRYITHTSVIVKLASRTFTILGDVVNGGLKDMPKNQYTIFEAIGAAGGVTDYGNRKTVRLIRETPGGTKIVNIDLTDESLLSSEYYYVLPNDVIFVEPNKFRIYTIRTLPWLNQASFAATLLSTAFLIINLFRK
jgi:polysaccharide biosynthesis/export protein